MTTVVDILTYEHNAFDIELNYVALAMSTLMIIGVFHLLHDRISFARKLIWLPIHAALFFFQITLCLAVLCSGISIVWSALDSLALILLYYLSKKGLYDEDRLPFLWVLVSTTWVYSLALWVYYAVTEDIITTVAHVLAILLGAGIGSALLYFEIFETDGPMNQMRPLLQKAER